MTSHEYLLMRNHLLHVYGWVGQHRDQLNALVKKLQTHLIMHGAEQMPPDIEFVHLFIQSTSPLAEHYPRIVKLMPTIENQMARDAAPPTQEEINQQVQSLLAQIRAEL